MNAVPIRETQVRDLPLHAYVEAHARTHPTRPAIHFAETTYTYGELQHQVEQLSTYLAGRGVSRGDTVAVFMQNSPQFVISSLAIQRLGGTTGPCNPMFKEWELEYQLRDLGAKVLLTFDDLLPVFRATTGTSVETVVLTRWSEATAAPDRLPVRDTVEPVHDAGVLETARFGEIVTRRADVVSGAEIDMQNDVALIIYTSGTTGKPKGAMLSFRNAEFKTAATVQTYGFTHEDVFSAAMPIFHIAGMTVGMNSPLMVGAATVIEARFDPDILLRDLEEHRVTVTYTTPPMVTAMLESDLISRVDLSAIRLSPGTSFGAQITEELSDQWEKYSGAPMFEWAYGMSETHTGNTQMPPEAIRYGCHGKPVFDTEIRIADPNDPARTMPQGQAGEILVKSPSVFVGYRNLPEATAEAMFDGWYRTGDIGRIDADGYLLFESRSKDMIKSNGYSVYPEEVEGMMVRHEAVREAAVVGYADAKRGESIRAYVVLSQGTELSEEELITWTRERMSAYKYPRQIRFVDQLPSTTTGKLQRARLRELD
ncbi:class I adenylate-forming enzyme family protein [Microbacterium sp. A93]|uniref:class I adenylate-forming enzyme family protein n=1 Tax=Microbacterium sp. A93 TaxID=3450716 RepID=UPI003F4432A7